MREVFQNPTMGLLQLCWAYTELLVDWTISVASTGDWETCFRVLKSTVSHITLSLTSSLPAFVQQPSDSIYRKGYSISLS